MLRTVTIAGIAIAAIFAATGPSFATNTLNNAQWGFMAAYADGWIVDQFSNGPVVASAYPPPPEKGVVCNTTAERIEATAKMTQAQINGQNAQAFPREFWAQSVYSAAKNVEFEKSGQRIHPSGISVQESLASFELPQGAAQAAVKAHTTIFVTPGVTFSMTCIAMKPKFETYRMAFATAIDSFRLTTVSADTNPAPANDVVLVKFNAAGLTGGVADGVAKARLQ